MRNGLKELFYLRQFNLVVANMSITNQLVVVVAIAS